MTSTKTVYAHNKVKVVSDSISLSSGSLTAGPDGLTPLTAWSSQTVSYRRTVPQVIPNNTETIVTFDTFGGVPGTNLIPYNGLSYPLGTNTFTVEVDSTVTIDYQVFFDTGSTGFRIIFIKINNDAISVGNTLNAAIATNPFTESSSVTLNLKATDTVEMWCRHSQGADLDVILGTNVVFTLWNGV